MKSFKTKLFVSILFLAITQFNCGGSASTAATEETDGETDSGDTTDGDTTGDDTTETTLCDASGITPANYLMSFHACNAGVEDCSIPNNHYIYLAKSDDGVTWELIEEFESFNGSVPAIVQFDQKLYLFSPGSGENDYDWYAYNACFELLDSGTLERTEEFETGTGFTDPSPLVVGDDLYIIRKASVTDSGAPCATACTIDAEVTTAADFPLFTPAGSLASMTSAIGSFTDPSIMYKSQGDLYTLFVSNGGNIYAYSSTSLDELSFTMPADYDANGTIGNADDFFGHNVGGVPGAVENIDDGTVLLYVNTAVSGGESDQFEILMATISDPTTAVTSSDFSVVIDETILPDYTHASIESPHIITWPDENWTLEQTVETQ